METTLGGCLAAQAQENPDRTSVIVGARSYTFRELDARASDIARGFAALGVRKGDRVATLMSNRPEAVELYFGLARLGAVQVPLNAYLKGEFLRHQLLDCAPRTVVADTDGVRVLRGSLDGVPEGDDETAYRDLDTDGAADSEQPAAGDLMSIVYTSGTTGLPKGCMLTHGGYLRTGRLTSEALLIGADDVLFTALPLFHSAARMSVLAAGLVRGASVVIEPTFSATGFLPRATEIGATLAFGVGAMGTALLALPSSPADRIRTMVLLPFTPELQQQFTNRFGIDAYSEGFGQTECLPVSLTHLAEGRRSRSSAGRPSPDLTVALLTEDVEVPLGQVGEICVRPNRPHAMFDGYWRNPEATLAALRNLWYHTGDLGRRNVDGTIEFVDRKKDAIRRRGENVSSAELEAAILQHPKVLEAAVIGVASTSTEQDIRAHLVPVAGATLIPRELFDFLRPAIPHFAMPRYVAIEKSLPRNAMSRVLKHQLRDRSGGDDLGAQRARPCRPDRRSAGMNRRTDNRKERSAMPTRTLGSHGLRVPAVGLGGISLSGVYGTFDEQAALSTIDRAIDLDAAFIDSADNYPDGHNEKLIGRAIRDRHEQVVLATKAGFDISRRSATQPFGAIDGRPAYLKAACERSLRNLGVDTIDLYYLHRIDPSVPVEDSIGAMSELLDQGKIRYLGICEAGADDLAKAAATAPISVLQCEWSLSSREVEDTTVSATRSAGIGIVAYRPLGIGVLAGVFARPDDLADDDIRRLEPRFADASLAKNLDLVSELRTLASGRGLTLAQLCLSWLLSRGDDVVPIPSTSKPDRLEENVAAAVVHLSETDLQRLEHIAPRHAWAGTRSVVTQTDTHEDSPT